MSRFEKLALAKVDSAGGHEPERYATHDLAAAQVYAILAVNDTLRQIHTTLIQLEAQGEGA